MKEALRFLDMGEIPLHSRKVTQKTRHTQILCYQSVIGGKKILDAVFQGAGAGELTKADIEAVIKTMDELYVYGYLRKVNAAALGLPHKRLIIIYNSVIFCFIFLVGFFKHIFLFA